MYKIEALSNVIGKECVLNRADTRALNITLPALAARQFEFFKAEIPGFTNQALIVKVKESLPIRIIENTYQRIQKEFPGIVIFYFNKLLTQDKQRLIRSKVQFFIADNFTHVPLLGFAGETKVFAQSSDDLIERFELSPMAETVVIGQLLDARFTAKNGKEIAEILGITSAAASQVLKELEKQRLVYLRRVGKAKVADFEERSVLWMKAQQFLRNPVEAELLIEKAPKKALKAGLSALAEITMLTDPEQKTFAVYKRHFEQQKNNSTKPINELIKLQLWKRDPTILSNEGNVDPLSLYLSLEGTKDERIQKELIKVLESLALEVPNGRD